jgi:hypothetical protein
MASVTTIELSGWGRYLRSHSLVHVPERSSEIDLRSGKQMIARGLGRTNRNRMYGKHGFDEIVVRHGGRVYLAKDARMRAQIFRAMYPRFSNCSVIRNRVDPQNRSDSDLARRLEMTVSLAGTAA